MGCNHEIPCQRKKEGDSKVESPSLLHRLTSKSIDKVLETISSAVPKWKKLIHISFLSDEMKVKYHLLLKTRLAVLQII